MESYDGYRLHRAGTGGSVSTARGKAGVACVSAKGSELAIEVLKDGGNAFDAAFALAFALAVLHPQAGNLGGGGYLLFLEKGAGKPVVYNYRECAPRGAEISHFFLPGGKADPSRTSFGPSSVCVPGTVQAFFSLQNRYGRLKSRDVLLQLSDLAFDGPVITEYQADCLNRLGPKLAESPESRGIYVRESGDFHAGDRLPNPHLAQTLKKLAAEGPDAFYSGSIAEQMERDLTGNGGFLTVSDLSGYQFREVEPIGIEIKGRKVWSVPPEGGGALLLEILNILNRNDFLDLKPFSTAYFHFLSQAAKLAFLDRLYYQGDVDLEENKVYERLLASEYALELFGMIPKFRDKKSYQYLRELGRSDLYAQLFESGGSDETTHFCIVDGQGNAVSNSYTLNLRYGSKWSIQGAGFLMNGSMDSFSFAPGSPNYFNVVGSECNLFAPGKRPASNMAPVMVTGKEGVEMVIGTPGGPTIPTTLAMILPALLSNCDPADCLGRERLHHQGWPELLYHEPGTRMVELLDELKKYGYAFGEKSEPISDVHGVFRQDGGFLSISDYRRQGNSRALL